MRALEARQPSARMGGSHRLVGRVRMEDRSDAAEDADETAACRCQGRYQGGIQMRNPERPAAITPKIITGREIRPGAGKQEQPQKAMTAMGVEALEAVSPTLLEGWGPAQLIEQVFRPIPIGLDQKQEDEDHRSDEQWGPLLPRQHPEPHVHCVHSLPSFRMGNGTTPMSRSRGRTEVQDRIFGVGASHSAQGGLFSHPFLAESSTLDKNYFQSGAHSMDAGCGLRVSRAGCTSRACRPSAG